MVGLYVPVANAGTFGSKSGLQYGGNTLLDAVKSDIIYLKDIKIFTIVEYVQFDRVHELDELEPIV